MAREAQSDSVNREPRYRCLGMDDVRAICASASLDHFEPERIERFAFQINPQIVVLNKVCSWSKRRVPYRRIANLRKAQQKIEDLWSSLWKPQITKICTLQMRGSSAMCRRVTSHLADHWAGKPATTIRETSSPTWETCMLSQRHLETRF